MNSEKQSKKHLHIYGQLQIFGLTPERSLEVASSLILQLKESNALILHAFNIQNLELPVPC